MAVSATHRGWLLKHNEGLLAGVHNGAMPGTTAHTANTALDGVLVGTPVTPALAVDSLVLSNVVASGDILLAANNGGNSQAWVHVDSSAGTMVLYGAGVTVATIAATALTIADDILLGVGTGSTARLSWDTTDANSNQLLLQLPAAGAVDSPVLVIGQSIESVDLGAAASGADYSGVVDPRIAIFSSGAVTTGPVLEFRKARGTTAAPTVVTTGDDLGTLDFYGAVANGEYVRAASIRADMAGTIATTRGPGTLTFLTATDAPPSVLTAALTLGADQSATFGGAVSIPSGTLTIADDTLLGLGTGNTARLSYDTTDANSNQLLLQLPAAGATDSPVLIIGQSIESIDFGAAAAGADYSAVADPRVALFASGAVTTGPVIEFRKARGTTAAPTVCTTGDDIGQITFYGAVANGEYVQSASIEADIAGTIATTRGPGTLTFKTATDAPPSVLTTALTISAAQLVTCAAGVTVTTGNVTISAGNLALSAASDITVPAATAAAVEVSDGTTKFYAIDTRVVTVGVTTHAFDISDYTLASAAGAVATGLSLAAHTLNLTGNTQVTTQVDTVVLGARTIAADGVGGACTVDEANTLLLAAPTEGSNVTLTAASALRILDAAGTPVNQYGIYIEAQSGGTTQNYAIYSAGGRNELLNSFTGDGRILKLSGTATDVATLDGYGAFEVDLTLAGTLANHSAAASAWVNITTGTVGAGNYICARNDGIYEATAATITNAKLIFGARMHYLADDTDGLRFPFSLNTNNTAITAVFDCQNYTDFGAVANAGSALNIMVPFCRDAGGTLRYIPLYALA